MWGAFVRASVSGDGCGKHWPLCGGEVIPHAHRVQTWIEFAHRVSSGLVLALIALLFIWAFRAYPRGHSVRSGVKLCLLFTCTEALLGAWLVLFRLVAHDASVYRAIAMSAHLVNTFLLLASLALTAWWASGGAPLQLRGQGPVATALGIGLIGTMILGVSGALTALGDTLFPAATLTAGIMQDFSPDAPMLIRLRLPHPFLAISAGLYLLLLAGLMIHLRPSDATRRFARWTGGLFLAELAIGGLNFALRAPIPMQIAHLFLADLVWLNVVLLSAAAVAEGVPHAELAGAAVKLIQQEDAGPATWRDYLALTKPRVISLLLFTTLAAMFIARPGWPGISLLLAVAIGGYMAAGAANTINMVIDTDIDGRMGRTTGRPTVTHKISSGDALRFALGLAIASFVVLWWGANLLAAMLALAGLVFYVLVYTLLLKRRTWHNIVIGGAAGAFPPLVGWAAAAGHLSGMAWLLFGIVFLWTPVHFWALALLIKDDYEAAGVPMLPVVRGVHATVLQIGAYAVLTAGITAVPFIFREMHLVYLGGILLLNGLLLLRSAQLLQAPDRRHAVSLYKYSMLYLALLFLVMAIDRAMPAHQHEFAATRRHVAAYAGTADWNRARPGSV